MIDSEKTLKRVKTQKKFFLDRFVFWLLIRTAIIPKSLVHIRGTA